jgi:NAD-dependent DNA ligase
MNIVFTGACEQFTRAELEKLLEDSGITLQKQVSGKTDILVLADKNSGTRKTEKARKLGIPVMLYEDFFLEYIPEYFI